MIKHINYKGKDYPISIGHYALTAFKKEAGKSFEQYSKDLQGGEDGLEKYEILMYHSLVAGARATCEFGKENEAKMPFSREQMVDVLDQCFWDFMKVFKEFMPGSKNEGNSLPNRTLPEETSIPENI